MSIQWPYADIFELRTVELEGEIVSVAGWRSDADRSAAFSEEPQFIFAMDRYYGDSDRPEESFRVFGSIFCGPYPRALAVLCIDLEPVESLLHSLAVPLVMVFPQNLVNRDKGKSLLELLRRQPNLRAQIYTGWPGVAGFFGAASESSRIEYLPVPIHPREFHWKVSQDFGFELPEWFLRMRW